MKAIDFVVRNGAGALQRGVVAADNNGFVLKATAGQEISFNLRQVDLQGYSRQGDDLTIVLADGRTIVIENYFNDAGASNRLFVSADGYLNEVAFVETTDGELYAQFGPTEQWGKWSPSDDLIYLGRTEIADLGSAAAAEGEVSMLGAALLGGSGLLGVGAGTAIVGATLLNEDDGTGERVDEDDRTPPVIPTGPADPTVDEPDSHSTVGGDDTTTHTITITGTGEPGDTVEVTAGDKVRDTTIDEDGTWMVTFEGDDFPSDGDFETTVKVTRGDELVADLDGPGFLIDTTPPDIGVTEGTGSTGDLVNSVVMDSGVVITGTGEAGASIEVTVQGVTRTTTVGEDGTWSVTYQAGVLDGGEYTSDITIVSSDAVGNTSTITDTLVVDTVTDVTIATSTVEGDGVINGAEQADGVTLTGTAQPGASVEVTFGTVTRTASVDTSGNWTVDFAASDIPTGEYDATVTAVATDAAGNSTTTSGTVQVDTFVNTLNYTSTTGGSDGVINATEAQAGLVVTGNAEPGSTVMVELGGVTRAATVAADGSWTATFSSDQIAPGDYTATMTATATDAAGNVDTITQSVRVDTDAGVLTISPAPIEGDDVINQAEASDGVVLSGTADPGAVVQVTLGTVTHTVVANAGGVWQAYYSAAEVPEGTYAADITATTTDSAGNTLTATDSVNVDTRVDNLSVSADVIEGDNMISGAERADGVQLTGTTEAGSTVMVTLGTATVQAIVDAHGNWVANFTPG